MLQPHWYRVQYYNNPNIPYLSYANAYKCITEDERIKVLMNQNSFNGEFFNSRPYKNPISISEIERYVTIDPTNIAFTIRDFELLNDQLWLIIQIIPTPSGKLLEDALTAYNAVKALQEPTWEVKFSGRYTMFRGDYRLVTIDAVMMNHEDNIKE